MGKSAPPKAGPVVLRGYVDAGDMPAFTRAIAGIYGLEEVTARSQHDLILAREHMLIGGFGKGKFEALQACGLTWGLFELANLSQSFTLVLDQRTALRFQNQGQRWLVILDLPLIEREEEPAFRVRLLAALQPLIVIQGQVEGTRQSKGAYTLLRGQVAALKPENHPSRPVE